MKKEYLSEINNVLICGDTICRDICRNKVSSALTGADDYYSRIAGLMELFSGNHILVENDVIRINNKLNLLYQSFLEKDYVSVMDYINNDIKDEIARLIELLPDNLE